MDDSISISESELKTVIDNLSSESTEISKSLEDISKLFDSFEFEGEIGDSIRTKFTAIEDTFSVVKTNVESCITDLQNLVTKFNDENSSTSLGDVDLAKGGETLNVKG